MALSAHHTPRQSTNAKILLKKRRNVYVQPTLQHREAIVYGSIGW
jgi:hypothetical protein